MVPLTLGLMYACRSFFSKSPASSKAKGGEPSVSPSANGSASKGKVDEDIKADLGDSPVLKSKSKRRRVIVDSEDEDDGGVVSKGSTSDAGDTDMGITEVNKNGTTTPKLKTLAPTTPTSRTTPSTTPTSRTVPPTTPTSRTTPSSTPTSRLNGEKGTTPPRRVTG